MFAVGVTVEVSPLAMIFPNESSVYRMNPSDVLTTLFGFDIPLVIENYTTVDAAYVVEKAFLIVIVLELVL